MRIFGAQAPAGTARPSRSQATVPEIRKQHNALNSRRNDTRWALAGAVHDPSGAAVASITLVGATVEVKPRLADLRRLLLDKIVKIQHRETGSLRTG